MDESIKKSLQKTACKVRMGVIEGTYNAKSGHPGGSLSISDTLTYLYFNKMNVDSNDPENPERDRLVLSKGHTAPALYSVLAQKGYFPEEELKSLRHIGALLQGPPCIHTPGVDMSSGSLGQGISCCLAEWLLQESSTINHIRSILFSETVRLRKDRYGKQQCLRLITALEISLLLLTITVCKSTVLLRRFALLSQLQINLLLSAGHVITMDGHDFDDIDRAFTEAKR